MSSGSSSTGAAPVSSSLHVVLLEVVLDGVKHRVGAIVRHSLLYLVSQTRADFLSISFNCFALYHY